MILLNINLVAENYPPMKISDAMLIVDEFVSHTCKTRSNLYLYEYFRFCATQQILILTQSWRTTKSYGYFYNDTATTEIYTLTLHDDLPICIHMSPLDCKKNDPS